MVELDLVWMSLVIFMPTAFALVLLFFPRGSEEYMRWWSLLGTVATLVVSLMIFIGYQANVITFNSSNPARGSLSARAASMDELVHKGTDWIDRVPWIPNFNIDYFLGI